MYAQEIYLYVILIVGFISGYGVALLTHKRWCFYDKPSASPENKEVKS